MEHNFFDRVNVISLRRTPERLRRFYAHMESIAWPFVWPVHYPAIDGDLCPNPKWYTDGGPGQWACGKSHTNVIEQALNDGVERLLIMEDDCEFPGGAIARVHPFIQSVPDDWHCLMIGGQQMPNGRFELVQPIANDTPVFRCSQVERMHCYALTRAGMESLYKFWSRPISAACDWIIGYWQGTPGVKCYRPHSMIACQGPNYSTLMLQTEPRRSWDHDTPAMRDHTAIPVITLKCPRAIAMKLIEHGVIHTGYPKDPRAEGDVEGGTVDLQGSNLILDATRNKTMDGERRLRHLVEHLRETAALFENAVVALWHPTETIEFPGAIQVVGIGYDNVKQQIEAAREVILV